ncbi:hypothetical protein, partial [Xanthomonas fragariae]|uniref:hypothetical protein n=1 Tax=Xanthomonas fragariae TaxID=48664 RepID=UPI00131F21F0
MSAALKNLRTHPTAKPVGNLRTSAMTPPNELRSRSVVESSCIRFLLAFVQRLLAGEGIYVWFAHAGDAGSERRGSH